MRPNKQIRTALTETKHCSQCTIGAVCCVQNKSIFLITTRGGTKEMVMGND